MISELTLGNERLKLEILEDSLRTTPDLIIEAAKRGDADEVRSLRGKLWSLPDEIQEVRCSLLPLLAKESQAAYESAPVQDNNEDSNLQPTDYESAALMLSELEEEERSLPEKLKKANINGDLDQVRQLFARRRELPDLILCQKTIALKAAISDAQREDELVHEKHESRMRQLADASAVLETELKALEVYYQSRIKKLRDQISTLDRGFRDSANQIEQIRQKLGQAHSLYDAHVDAIMKNEEAK